MPITKSAKKALRGSRAKRQFNLARLKKMRELISGFKKAASGADRPAAVKLLPDLYQAIDKAAKRGVIKKAAAARKKSRLTRLLSLPVK